MLERNWPEFWKGYSRTTGSLTWRVALPDDLPAIRRLRNVSERFLGVPQRNPSLFQLPVLLALVAENERGKIVDCVYVEAQVELIKMACTAQGFEESAGLSADLAGWLRAIGFKTVTVTTRPTLKERMAGVLSQLGFRSQDGELSFWRMRL